MPDTRLHKNLTVILHEWYTGEEHNVNVNKLYAKFKVGLGFNGRLATTLTGVYGSMYFVYFIALGVTSWMLWQTVIDRHPFDPWPFAFLLFLGNLIQLVGGPIIQVGQNLANAHSELRAEADYHVNQEAFSRMERVLTDLSNQDVEMLKQTHRLEQVMTDIAGQDTVLEQQTQMLQHLLTLLSQQQHEKG